MDKKSKISKAKGVEICADLIFFGQTRKDIVPKLTNDYGVSISCVEKWMRAAQPVVDARRAEANRVRAEADADTMKEIARELGLNLKDILAEYKKIGFADIRKVFTEEGGLKKISEWDDNIAGAISAVESVEEKDEEGMAIGMNRKLKLWDKKGALDSICKTLGYLIPKKDDETPPLDLSTQPVTFE